MAVTKHKLTTGADKITGGSGSDLFIAALDHGAATLTGNDRLNGGGGSDTVRAALVDGDFAPGMKNIERGIFQTRHVTQTQFDLVHAAQMTDLTFMGDGKASAAWIYLDNAAHVEALAMRKINGGNVGLNDVDPTVTRDMTVSFQNTDDASLSLIANSHAVFRSVHVDVSETTGTSLTGNCVATRHLYVNSDGTTENYLSVDPVMNTHFIRNLTVTGTQKITLYNSSDAYLHLQSYDASGMTGTTWATIGGKGLHDVTGGSGGDALDIKSIGGSENSPAHVSLGGGVDYLTLDYAFDPQTQRYNGGKDFDDIILNGSASDLNHAAKNFEEVDVRSSAGLYEVNGMKLVNFMIRDASAATTIDHLSDKATLGFYTDTAVFVTVNVVHAAGSTTDSLRALLQNSTTLGTQSAGFMAPSLSNLQIDCYSDDHVMYLGSVGSSTDSTYVHITGATHLELHASNASSSYISELVIDNGTAGADIAGLADGTKAFIDTGATITGGDGDDVLVGGDGADTISTGGGNNTVHGSLGADLVTLTANSGADLLAFESMGQSSYGSGQDTVDHFGIFDGIDIGAIASDVSFAGNFATYAAGNAALSSSHASAYFNTADHTLYIDLNHDKAFGSLVDMAIHLNGVDSFSGANLIS
jgi:Ca2+-binding RTX toxin-like protein